MSKQISLQFQMSESFFTDADVASSIDLKELPQVKTLRAFFTSIVVTSVKLTYQQSLVGTTGIASVGTMLLGIMPSGTTDVNALENASSCPTMSMVELSWQGLPITTITADLTGYETDLALKDRRDAHPRPFFVCNGYRSATYKAKDDATNYYRKPCGKIFIKMVLECSGDGPGYV